MSISTLKFFDLASLAEAAYSDFGSIFDLKSALLDEGFSSVQADDILSRWATDKGWHNSGAGFSSTLTPLLQAQYLMLL